MRKEREVWIGRWMLLFGVLLLFINYVLVSRPESWRFSYYPAAGVVVFMGLVFYLMSRFK